MPRGNSSQSIKKENIMKPTIEIKVPDIGDFKNVPVIEVLVKVGDKVEAEQSLITLETDKATMEVPAPVAGVAEKYKVFNRSSCEQFSGNALEKTRRGLELERRS